MSKQKVSAGISEREAEVLALVGQHRSNAEIAAQLYISVRTVETHVSSLLRKVGVPDRRALAGRAAELTGKEPTEEAATLPSPLTSFVGRTSERVALREAVTAHRHVTALGPGGVGKTRLALAVAADLAGAFGGGAWFVDLVPVTDPEMTGSAVARALGLGEQQGRGLDDSVLSALADRHTLLVLDNCEHLLDGVVPFVERLLAHCPRVSVLATSRARLMVPFEQVYPVPPLSVDGGTADAVALFLDRAAALGSTVPAEQLDQVSEVCQRLDGLRASRTAESSPSTTRSRPPRSRWPGGRSSWRSGPESRWRTAPLSTRRWPGSRLRPRSWMWSTSGCGGTGTRRCARKPRRSPAIRGRPSSSPRQAPWCPGTRSPAPLSTGPSRCATTTSVVCPRSPPPSRPRAARISGTAPGHSTASNTVDRAPHWSSAALSARAAGQ
ncbi:LuxR C-terminal-related transcriptional regulator [Nocardia sp. CC227C]|uniref:ATP-binding protein n=1 Tax=Nocardia sp. CC227C TaxID=3044562 RepID=UPI00278C2697|nr:LuxR C-terminal-related transcriptional regulator [Nocardia sp. CC227C]